MKQINKCPFCKSDAALCFSINSDWVSCINEECSFTGPMCRTEQKAIDTWNLIRVLDKQEEKEEK